MSPERWHKLESLFDAALARPPETRAAFLEEACADDADLRHQVQDLLEAADEADDYFSALAGRVGVPALTDLQPPGETVSETPISLETRRFLPVGHYQIIRELGRGGMGIVYLAHRADTEHQFEHQVALKVIKRGLDSGLVLQRFLRERQILARLRHPGIAQFYDGGITDEGQPYFAMEYVEGTPLTTYCDAQQLDVQARLRLFEAVGEAVHYAHRNLIVHRDLKPSNILVTEDQQIKLLDFGIAKLLGGEEEDLVTLTMTGMQAMTPAYAAPEQVRGEPVTTATDVYALGVILYELLTGQRPYQLSGKTSEEIARIILGEHPQRPSTAVGTSTPTGTPEPASPARNTPMDRRRRRLAGDLDTICLKALRKEPERRYTSAEALVDDIKRHLAGLPVRARPDTARYRIRKFIGRNRVGVTAAGLVASSLVLGLGAALWQAQVASQEATKAREVKELLVKMFEQSDPDEARGETITAREVLDEGAARIRNELATQPDVQGELMNVMGQIYHKLGLFDAALPLLQDALASRRALHRSDHRDLGESHHRLASLLHDMGNLEEAETQYRHALAMRRAVLGNRHKDVAESLAGLAIALYDQGRYDDAHPFQEQALAMRRAVLGDSHEDVAESLNALAWLHHAQGNYDDAAPLYREALAIRRARLGDEHYKVAASLNNLATLLFEVGDLDGAEPLYRETITILQTLRGNAHPSIAATQSNLATLLHEQGDLDGAEPLYREALAMERQLLGDEHPSIAISISNLALLLQDKGDLDAAAALFHEALAMDRKLLGNEHPDVGITLSYLASLLHAKGDLAAAARYEETLAVYRATLSDDHPRIADVRTGLGQLYSERGAHDKAEPLLRQALQAQRAALGDTHWRTARAQTALGACLTAQGRYEEAETLLLASYPVFQKERGEQHKLTRRTRQALADLYTAWDQPEHAARYQPPPGE